MIRRFTHVIPAAAAALIALVIAAHPAFAAPQYDGRDMYATGDALFLEGFNPGSNAALKMEDEGADGDAVKDDGVFSRLVSVPQDSTTSGSYFWKVSDPGFGFGIPADPASVFRYQVINPGDVRFPIPGNVLFYLNTNSYNDGWRPDVGAGDRGLIASNPNPHLIPQRVYRAVGNWQDEAGLGGDFQSDSPLTIMRDDGLSGDATAGDLIYTLEATGLAIGAYQYKVTIDGNYDVQVTTVGMTQDTFGSTYDFNVASTSDTVKFLLNIGHSQYRAGSIKVETQTPLGRFVTGDGGFLDGFNPGSNPDLEMLDDGTQGDAAADDGVFSRTVTIPQDGTSSGTFLWKYATQGFLDQWPAAFIDSIYTTRHLAPGSLPMDVTFYVNFNPQNDGFGPDPAFGARIISATPNPLLSPQRVFRATGNWLDDAGLSFDWDPGSPATIMNDAGEAGDATADDGIYTLQAVIANPGTYGYKVTIDGTFEFQVNGFGLTKDVAAGEFNFSTFVAGERITFLLNTNNDNFTAGRIAIQTQPRIFAVCDQWTTDTTSASVLNDEGENGDVAAGDGIFSRQFIVARPGQFSLRVRYFDVGNFPDSGDYPFRTFLTRQNVLVQFDTNVYPDSNYLPDRNFVFVNQNAARPQPRIQAVGNWQDEYGGFQDWDTAEFAFWQLRDDGLLVDATAGDKIYATQFGPTFFQPPANPVIKFIGEPDANHPAGAGAAPYAYQFGGEGEGYTKFGNNNDIAFVIGANPNSFVAQVDAITGRAGVGTAPPQRPPTIGVNPPLQAIIEGWMMR